MIFQKKVMYRGRVRVIDAIKLHAQSHPDAPAILAPGRRSLTYALVEQETRSIREQLQKFGFLPSGRVAISLKNGPEAVLCLLAVMEDATAVPLDPCSKDREFSVALSGTQTTAVIVAAGAASSIQETSHKYSASIIELFGTAGSKEGISLRCAHRSAVDLQSRPSAFDVALLMLTSGTTSFPKVVPVSHSNLLANLKNVQAVLELKPNDRCLNVMPLFHLHGIIFGVLASLTTGGSVVCPSGFSESDF
ncbi:MAG TPA: AMP-binding protein, partial [Acidobacteriota bacterium]